MAPIIAIIFLILLDLISKRRETLVAARITCIAIPASLLVLPLIFHMYLQSGDLVQANYRPLFFRLFAWTIAVAYLCLRVMLSQHTYFPPLQKALLLTGLGMQYNIAVILAYFTSIVLLVAVLFTQSIQMLEAVGMLALVGVLLCMTILLFPVGATLLVVSAWTMAWQLFHSVAGVLIILIGFGFVLAGSTVLGIKIVRDAVKYEQLPDKYTTIFLIFMCVPLANTIPMYFFRKMKQKAPV